MAKATAVRVSTGKKFSQLLIITPAVAIDSNEHDDYHGPFNSSSLDSGCGGSSEGSLSDDLLEEDEQRRHRRRQTAGMVVGDRRNNNNGTAQRSSLLDGNRERRDGGASSSQQGGSWRWCGLICSAVKCFRAAAATTSTSGRRHTQQGSSSRQPLTGTTVRYTTSEGVWSGMESGGIGRRSGSSRFSNNHVYEYTIKSYHHPSQRRSNGGNGSVTLPPTGASRSDSISSDSSALSGLAETGTLADNDHINNNSTVGNNNGNILSSSAAGGSCSIVVTTATASGSSSPTIGRVTERNNIMYKL